MTYEEAFEILRDTSIYINSARENIYTDYATAQMMALNSIEKQIPKKPIIKSEKEVPITHNYGRLLRFHCPRCERFLVGLYETDVERGGGISRRMKGCSTCLQAIDFTGYYYIDKMSDEIDWSE